MKILLDECTPRVVQKRLPQLNIQTVQELGWSGLKNGELLAAAEGQFDVFITTDNRVRGCGFKAPGVCCQRRYVAPGY